MKDGRLILAFLAVAIFLTAASAFAQEPYQMPIRKTIAPVSVVPVTTVVPYNGIVYTFGTSVAMSAWFEAIDVRYVRLTVKSATDIRSPFTFSLQWGLFPANLLEGGGGSTSFILDSETGYAEK